MPLASMIHQSTMAVHGDIPSRIVPAMKSGWPARITFEYRVMRGGAITQFAMIVMSMGPGDLTAFLTSLNLMAATVGYIMRKRRMPMGMDMRWNFNESMYWPNSGRNLPRRSPASMQSAIQSVRYFS